MKTQEQKIKETKDYIAKSAQHLFSINDKILYKIISFSRDGQVHYATITFIGENVNLRLIDINRYKSELKHVLFPKYLKTISIPYFKKMRNLITLIESELSLHDNKKVIEKIENKLKDLNLVKQ